MKVSERDIRFSVSAVNLYTYCTVALVLDNLLRYFSN
jgi:hypothetical protein